MDIWDIFQEFRISEVIGNIEDLKRKSKYDEGNKRRTNKEIANRISSLEREHDRLTLLVYAISKSLEDAGILDAELLNENMKLIDELDGKVDGKVTRNRAKKKLLLKAKAKRPPKTLKLPKID